MYMLWALSDSSARAEFSLLRGISYLVDTMTTMVTYMNGIVLWDLF